MKTKMEDLILPLHRQPRTLNPRFPFPISLPLPRAKSPKSKCKCSQNVSTHPLFRPKSTPLIEQQHKKKKEEVSEEYLLSKKLAYLESIGVDSYSAVSQNPSISTTATLESIGTVVRFLQSIGLAWADFGRLFGLCPELLTASVPRQLRPVITFLLREVNIEARHLRRVIYRRPRLLACSVKDQLRPTLYFLHRLGFDQVGKYSFLLSCSVEEKFIPRLEFIQSLGLSYDDAASMFLKFPALFNYSISGNLKPKHDYLVKDMGRSVDDLKAFPQYFGHSLEKRIKPRHRFLLENGVHLPLCFMLSSSDARFYRSVKELQDETLHLQKDNVLYPSHLYNKRTVV